MATTALIVLGATLATAAHGAGGNPAGLFWFLTIARYSLRSTFRADNRIFLIRGITGVVSLSSVAPQLSIKVICPICSRVLAESIQPHPRVQQRLPTRK